MLLVPLLLEGRVVPCTQFEPHHPGSRRFPQVMASACRKHARTIIVLPLLRPDAADHWRYPPGCREFAGTVYARPRPSLPSCRIRGTGASCLQCFAYAYSVLLLLGRGAGSPACWDFADRARLGTAVALAQSASLLVAMIRRERTCVNPVSRPETLAGVRLCVFLQFGAGQAKKKDLAALCWHN